MTKTIEFIKQNIFECKNHIQHLNNKINEDKKYPSLVKYHKEQIENLKPILQILEQIKCELEAWEIVKEYTDTSEDIVNTEYYFIKGLDDEFETLKQALEVGDE